MPGEERSPRLRLLIVVTTDMPMQLKVLHAVRLAKLRFGQDCPVVLELDRPRLDVLARLIDNARRELDGVTDTD